MRWDFRTAMSRRVCLRRSGDCARGNGRHITIVTTGIMASEGLTAARMLADQKISARVVHMPTVKPRGASSAATTGAAAINSRLEETTATSEFLVMSRNPLMWAVPK